VSHDREGRQDTLSLEFDLLNLFSWGRGMPLYVIKVVEKKNGRVRLSQISPIKKTPIRMILADEPSAS
jgi:hypothetical protein